MLLRSPPRRLHLLRPHHFRSLSNAAAAALPSFTRTPPPMPTEWTEVPVSSIRAATRRGSNLYHVSLDLSSQPSLLASHVAAGQHLTFRFPAASYPLFLPISSPPPASTPDGPPSLPKSFDFLVKDVRGTPNRDLNCSSDGDFVSVGGSVGGPGIEVGRIADAREVLIFAYGTGISPIRSLIESGFGENENIDVTLFYGDVNLDMMAYQNAYKRTKKVVNPSAKGAILCGRRRMYEEVTRVLVANGVSVDRIITSPWLPSGWEFPDPDLDLDPASLASRPL